MVALPLHLLPLLATPQQDQTQHTTRSWQQQPSQHLLNAESSKPAIHAPSRRQQQNQAPPNCHQPNTQPNRRQAATSSGPTIKPKRSPSTRGRAAPSPLSQPATATPEVAPSSILPNNNLAANRTQKAATLEKGRGQPHSQRGEKEWRGPAKAHPSSPCH